MIPIVFQVDYKTFLDMRRLAPAGWSVGKYCSAIIKEEITVNEERAKAHKIICASCRQLARRAARVAKFLKPRKRKYTEAAPFLLLAGVAEFVELRKRARARGWPSVGKYCAGIVKHRVGYFVFRGSSVSAVPRRAEGSRRFLPTGRRPAPSSRSPSPVADSDTPPRRRPWIFTTSPAAWDHTPQAGTDRRGRRGLI